MKNISDKISNDTMTRLYEISNIVIAEDLWYYLRRRIEDESPHMWSARSEVRWVIYCQVERNINEKHKPHNLVYRINLTLV